MNITRGLLAASLCALLFVPGVAEAKDATLGAYDVLNLETVLIDQCTDDGNFRPIASPASASSALPTTTNWVTPLFCNISTSRLTLSNGQRFVSQAEPGHIAATVPLIPSFLNND